LPELLEISLTTEEMDLSSGRLWPYLPMRGMLGLLLAGVVSALLIAFMATTYYQLRWDDEWDKVRVEEAHHVQLQQEELSDDLRHIAYTLAFLRDQVGIHLSSASPVAVDFFKYDLFSFIKTSELYDQIHLIDPSGMEIARVDYKVGQAVITPDDRLQFKGDRYYFKQAVGLDKGEMYISPVDLNIEHGQVERPFKPVMRFAMPVFDAAGLRRGVLVLNYLIDGLLKNYRDTFRKTAASSQLLNADGYWLYHPDSRYEWGHVLPERSGQNMGKIAPESWRQISSEETGQFVDQGQLISFATVRPLAQMTRIRGLQLHPGDDKTKWKVVSSFPALALRSQMAGQANQIALLAVMFFAVVFMLLVVSFRAREKELRYRQSLHIRMRAMEASPAGIVLCDARQDDLPMIYCNDAFARLTGYPREDLLNRNCRLMQSGDREQPAVATMREAVAEAKSCMVTLRNYRADGSMFWNEVSITPVHDNNGQLKHFIGYHQDVTARVQSDKEQQQLLSDVKQLSQSLLTAHDMERQAMARSLHDDIGQLTTALMLHAELAGMACRAGDAVKAAAAIDELGEMVKLLMQAVRASLNALREGAPGGLALGEQLEQLCAGWRQPGFAIDLTIEADLAAIEPATARHIYHIVQEALNNVVRHARASRVSVSLTCSTIAQVRVLTVEVQDDGCGFDATNTHGCMGVVGMCERIEAMGGSWLLKSQPGEGTVIGGTIPLPD